jgi:uncharacterized protein (DUF1684 family)
MVPAPRRIAGRIASALVAACCSLSAGSALAASSLASASLQPADAGLEVAVAQWRADRIAALTSESGWLTPIALLPLRDGSNPFGRSTRNPVRLDHAAVPSRAGRFDVKGTTVSFEAAPRSGITLDGAEARRVALRTDASGTPTILSLGTLRLFVIERAGKLFVRVRDLANPRRTSFAGIDYFPVGADWMVTARFEPYSPPRTVPILNVLGMEVPMISPGAIVFEHDGHTWRLDAIDEDPSAATLSVMFADGTTGRETYGAGRFLDVPRPQDGSVQVDFNRAYNPPCAFNDFATCPLPPAQNRIALRVEAGEKKYRH